MFADFVANIIVMSCFHVGKEIVCEIGLFAVILQNNEEG